MNVIHLQGMTHLPACVTAMGQGVGGRKPLKAVPQGVMQEIDVEVKES